MSTNLLAAEWLKLTKRPLAWVLLAIFLALMVLYFSLEFLLVGLHEGTLGGGAMRLQALNDAQIAQFKRHVSFPGVFGAVLGQVNSVGGICAIILAAGALGSEYNWGTLRLQLTHDPRRGTYLVAKLVALLLMLLVAIAIALLAGALLVWLFSGILGLPNTFAARDLLLLPLGIGRALFVILPYLMCTLACAALGRSVLAGAGGGLVFLALDMSAGSLTSLGLASPLVSFFVNLLIQPNINTMVVLNSQLYGLDPAAVASALNLAALPSPLHATLVIAAYSALFFAYAHWALTRRDISGAT